MNDDLAITIGPGSFRYLIVALFHLLACNSEQEHGNSGPETPKQVIKTSSDTSRPVEKHDFSNGNFFADIDIYRMQGIDEVNDQTFPSIYIEETGPKKKKIVFRNSEKYSWTVSYKYDKGLWVGTWEERGDTGVTKVYQFIKPEQIFELIFEGTWKKENFRLHQASIFENNKRVCYTLDGEPGIDAKAELSSFDLVKKKHDTVFEDEYTRSEGKLYVTRKIIGRGSNTPTFRSIDCYDVGKHSVIWVDHFGHDFQCLLTRSFEVSK